MITLFERALREDVVVRFKSYESYVENIKFISTTRTFSSSFLFARKSTSNRWAVWFVNFVIILSLTEIKPKGVFCAFSKLTFCISLHCLRKLHSIA